jgi:hypothetical protein
MRALANGTSGAHAAIPKPAMKNTMRVEICSRRAGAERVVADAMGLLGQVGWTKTDMARRIQLGDLHPTKLAVREGRSAIRNRLADDFSVADARRIVPLREDASKR